jgi:CRISPR-associated protein Csd2
MTNIQNRYEFVLLFDVKDGNPNGDPDGGNLPRTDAETGQGLVTDVCLKRKVRNYIGLLKEENPPYEIYVKEKSILNNQHERAYTALNIQSDNKKRSSDSEAPKRWMCENFYDVRTFGAVMTTGVNCGQVRGPVQLTFARSIDPITQSEHSITRMAVTTEAESLKQEGGNRTMGRKHTVPYGLYRAHGFVSASLAEKTGFTEDDLKLFWDSLKKMFEHDRSASRGEMNTRGLYVFKHDSKLGNAPAHELFERVEVKKRSGLDVSRACSDYDFTVNEQNMPEGVELICMVDARRKAALV